MKREKVVIVQSRVHCISNISTFFKGEGNDVAESMTAPWKETVLPTIISNYEPRNIFNADEFGLFYQALPKKTLNLKGEKYSGGKNNNIRLTGLAAANMIGEKLPMFVIGKSQKPRCFKHIKSLPCRYGAQKKSWMNSELFEEWVREQDEKFENKGRKVALIIDTCPAHPVIENLKSITLYFLPPNTTSAVQPMDQGVIWSLKSKYRTHIIQKVLAAIDQGKQLPVISIFEAIKVLALSWSEVSKEAITNCFTKSGFSEDVCSEEDDDSFFQLREAFDKLCAHGQGFVPDGLQCEDIVHVDRDVQVTEGLLTEEEIVEEIRGIFDEENENDVEIAERSEDIPIKPSSQEVFRAVETLLDYSMFTNSGEIGKLATKVPLMVEKENLKLKRQKKITDFF